MTARVSRQLVLNIRPSVTGRMESTWRKLMRPGPVAMRTVPTSSPSRDMRSPTRCRS